MRTTVDIPDDLYRRLKAKAALEGTTVREAVVQMVTRELQPLARGGRCRLPLIKGKERRVLNLTRPEIDDILFG